MTEIDVGDDKLDLYFEQLLGLVEDRISSVYIHDENNTRHSLSNNAYRKLLLAAAVTLLKVGDRDDAVTGLIDEITKLVPEMEQKGWLRLDDLANGEKEKIKAKSVLGTIPDGFNAWHRIEVPEMPQSNESFFVLKWTLPVKGTIAPDDTICTISDSTQEHNLTAAYTGILVEQAFGDNDLVQPGDVLGLMVIKYPVD